MRFVIRLRYQYYTGVRRLPPFRWLRMRQVIWRSSISFGRYSKLCCWRLTVEVAETITNVTRDAVVVLVAYITYEETRRPEYP